MKKILETLAEKIKTEGVETFVDDSDGTDTLRIAPDTIGPDDDGVIVMEICRIPVEDVEDVYIQLYTTVAKDIAKDKFADTLDKLNEINLRTLLGSYHILTEYGMMYHKYVLRLPRSSEEFLMENIFRAICDCVAIIDNDYPELLSALL